MWLRHGLVFSGFKLGRGFSARNVRDPLGDGWSEDGDTPTQLPICKKRKPQPNFIFYE
jgi:hypothetical protein